MTPEPPPQPAPPPRSATRRWLRSLLGFPLALLILFEEWGWEPLQRLMATIARLPLLAVMERRIAALPPYAALAVFLLPSLALLPVKLAALWLIGQGHALLGAGVIVVAKLVGTALVARLFTLTRPALMQLAWFERAYGRFTAWKHELLLWVRGTFAWRWGRVLKRSLKRRWALLRGP
ncbi:hypothetical protein BurJ1DRAFT_0110 [Burkholderiales bacterium JOSHI_001]|nr:hypothetical protein BurJ1DRAFT_0110 [Burkholderiales bacterium JOSHI_001]